MFIIHEQRNTTVDDHESCLFMFLQLSRRTRTDHLETCTQPLSVPSSHLLNLSTAVLIAHQTETFRYNKRLKLAILTL